MITKENFKDSNSIRITKQIESINEEIVIRSIANTCMQTVEFELKKCSYSDDYFLIIQPKE